MWWQQHVSNKLGQRQQKAGKFKCFVLFFSGKYRRHILWTKEERNHPACYQCSVQIPSSLMGWGYISACRIGNLHIW